MSCNFRRVMLALSLAAASFNASFLNHGYGGGIGAQDDQVNAANAASQSSPSAAGMLADGLSLENSRAWGDAIRHYESALRTFEDDPQLNQRLLICRLHFDVHRRYEDKSFQQSVKQLSTQEALELYAEVLSNLETYYVDMPNWSQVLRYGTASLEVALTEPEFVATNLAGVDPDKIEQFRQTVHRYVNNRPSGTRFDLRANAAYVAGLAHQQLGLSGTATVLEYVCGSVSTLDTYSRFLTSSQLDDTFSNIEGNFVGLGVELKALDQMLRVVNVIPGGSAEEAGLVPGDSITSVEGISTLENNPDYVADLLRGPENSLVVIDVRRRDGSTVSMKVARRRVEVPSVENVRIVDADTGTGYFRLTNFQKTTVRDVDNALWNLHQQGMRRLIMDLRGNPGGLLTAAVEIADHFIDRGRIVITRGRYLDDNRDYFAHVPNTWNVPLIVLIDGDSASASEIFAGAIRDSKRGVLVGQRTYGKGSVQGIFRMQSARVGLSLTTAKFFSPNNIAISKRGVSPHLSVEPTYISARPTETGDLASIAEDAILTAAISKVRVDAGLVQQATPPAVTLANPTVSVNN